MTGIRVAGLTIRGPGPEDAARLASLSSELGYPATARQIAARLADLVPRADHCVRLAQSLSGEVVGWVHAHDQLILEADPWCEIAGLVVAAGQRGKGVGRALLGAVEAWARSRGRTVVKVRSNVVRQESHPFYEHQGFARIKTQHVYRKQLE